MGIVLSLRGGIILLCGRVGPSERSDLALKQAEQMFVQYSILKEEIFYIELFNTVAREKNHIFCLVT